MKKIAILTISDSIAIDLAQKIADIYSDDQFKFYHYTYEKLKEIDVNEYNGMIITNFDYCLNRRKNPILTELKEKKYHGKIAVSLNNTDNPLNKLLVTGEVLIINDFYWQEMDKIKNFILS